MNSNLGIAHFLQNADSVSKTILAIMLVMSCGTWYIIVAKSIQTIRMRGQIARFLDKFWKAPSLDSVEAILKDHGEVDPFSRLVRDGLSATRNARQDAGTLLALAGADEDFLTRTLKRSIEEDALHLESGLSFVATVASSAPFIGLFGTVWGIYHALIAIGISGQGTLDKVAGPVGEALIMTAIGLIVAIPAAISYNFFARTNRGIEGRLDSFAHDIHTLLSRGIKITPTHRLARGK